MLEQIISHLIQHWALTSFAVLLVVLLVWNETRTNTNKVFISPAMAVKLINHSNATVIDLRSPSAFKQARILNAINIPSSEFSTSKKLTQPQILENPFILIPARGDNPNKQLSHLTQLGANEVYVLENGMEAWRQAGQIILD